VAISEAQTDATPVFETIARNAHRLSGAVLCNVLRFDGKLLHIAACHGFSPAQEQEIRRKYPVEAGDASVLSGRVVLNGRTEQIEDTLADPRYDRAHAGIVGWRRMLGVPMIREGVVQGVIVLAWREPGQTPPGLVDLLKTFADQAVIAIENVRLFNETREALDRQTATAEILQVISGSVSDAAPVFEKILESCDHLFDSTEQGVLLLGDDGRLHLGAHHGIARERLEGLFPVHQTAGLVASILDRQVLHFRNALEDPDVPAGIRAVAERIRIGAYSQVFAPMVWEGRAIGTLYVTRQPPTGFAPKEIDLLRTFADQAVIAIQNARLFRETREALDRQTATSEVLRVISRSPTDVQPVFEAVAERSGLLCHAEGSRIFLPDGDSLLAVTGYRSNAGVDGGRGDRLPKKPTSVIGRAFLQGGVVQVEDASLLDPAAYPDTAAMHQRHGFRTVLAVPMMRGGAAVGVIGLSRRDARAFSDREIELVRTFADQAVIAIQNVRLFNETREALEQQTATADILRVISGSPTDTQPVFDAILERATKLCDAGTGLLFRYEDGAYVALATRMADPAAAEVFRHPRRPGPNSQTGLGRLMRDLRAVHIPDMMNDPAYDARDPLRMDSLAAGMRSWLGVPMLKEGALVGAIVIYRSEPRPFSEQQIALLQTFADQAVIAIQNARLFNETREALERQTAIADILSVISSSPTDTGPVFEAIVQSCQRLFGGLFVAFARPRGELLHMVAHADDGTPRGRAGAELPPWPLDRGSGAGTCILEARVVNVADTEAAVPQFPRMRDLALRLGYRSGLFVPLLRDERAVGAIVILRAAAGAFNEREVDLARAFADQAVIAIENVRLFNEIEDKSRQLELANKHKSEFLANMSHELRTPLNAIIGFSEVLAERMFGEVNDKQLEYLKDIHASGHHLLSLINDILDLSKIEAGRMELDLSTVNLPMLLDNCTTLVRERASRQGLTLSLEVEEGVGDWVADVRKVKQIVINLLSNAVKFTPAGGRVTLRARRIDEQVEIAVIDTGVGISPDQQALVFEEFRQAGGDYLRKAEGTGLGLSLAKRFVELHGGTIRVDSAPGNGSTFAFVLPRGEAVAPVALQA